MSDDSTSLEPADSMEPTEDSLESAEDPCSAFQQGLTDGNTAALAVIINTLSDHLPLLSTAIKAELHSIATKATQVTQQLDKDDPSAWEQELYDYGVGIETTLTALLSKIVDRTKGQEDDIEHYKRAYAILLDAHDRIPPERWPELADVRKAGEDNPD